MSTTESLDPSISIFRKACVHKMYSAIQILYGDAWQAEDYDRKLRIAVESIIATFGILGVMIQSRELEVSLCCPNKDPRIAISDADRRILDQELKNTIHKVAKSNSHLQVSDSVNINNRFYRIVADRIAFDQDHSDCIQSLIAIGYSPKEMWSRITNKSADNYNSELLVGILEESLHGSILPLLADAFRHRDRRFAAFPPKLIERYWYDAPYIADKTRLRSDKTVFQPPWDTNVLIKTSTLSIDLRKSTFCMEFARSERDFGRWLDQMVEKMRYITHQHGGIFDKFTGDGALVHFLQEECLEIYNRSAVDAAVNCAVDMQRAIEIHMKELRKFLQHDSPKFGAGIAIDTGMAFWSADHRDNPIVVGKGVVGACRVGDKAPRGCIRFTNLAYFEISDQLRKLFGSNVSASTFN